MSIAGRFDVIIIGTGAGGGTLAHALADSGKRILLVERGDVIPREPDNWDAAAVYGRRKYCAAEVWHDDARRPIHPQTCYAVGGNTKIYGAALMRMRLADFSELRHADGSSPAWPIGYDELEPFYARAESLYQVHGCRGEDPTEPPASGPFPHPPVSHEPHVQQLVEALRRLGCRPFHLPLGVLLDETDPARSRCIRCASCDGYPCKLGAKADSEVVAVVPATAQPNVTLLTGARATRLTTSASGRQVTSVTIERNSELLDYAADIVVLACGAINSPALLLRSIGSRHPNGLANSSGLVGRCLMRHNSSVVLAIATARNETTFQQTAALNDFYLGADDWRFPMGNIQLIGKSVGTMLRSNSGLPLPTAAFDAVARRAIDFWVMSEDLPDPANGVTIDAAGTPVLRYRENNLAAHARLVAALKTLLKRVERESRRFRWVALLSKRIPIDGVAHCCGTLRFGTSPADSVLDTNCRTHDVDNLYVVDGSFLPSSGAVNPGLTIMANALRVGAHLRQRLG